MFLKPFKIKSSIAIKGSDRKKLRQDLSNQYPSLTSEELLQMIPNKEELSVAKLIVHNGETVTVYMLLKNPVLFELEKVLYPTIYTMWIFLDLLPSFTTWPAVFDKLAKGADLMLPGIITFGEYGPKSFGKLNKGDLCSVNLANNKAPVAVGKAALSSNDMFLSGKRGKGVIILHTYQDQLWALGNKTLLPNLSSPLPSQMLSEEENQSQETESDKEVLEEESVLLQEQLQDLQITDNGNYVEAAKDLDGLSENKNLEEIINNFVEKDQSEVNNSENIDSNVEIESPTELMDKLLHKCFLQAWKTSAKKLELPVLTSTFYKVHMLPCCPKDQVLDAKKSSYKKISKFLMEMQKKGIIQVKELSKGVESIVAVNHCHLEIQSFKVEKAPDDKAEIAAAVAQPMKYEPPEITEMYSITADVLPVFVSSGLRKGDGLKVTEIRSIVTEYVKKHELQDRRLVKLDDVLKNIVLKRSEYEDISLLKWDEFMTRFLEKMKPAYQIKFQGQKPVFKKGQLQPIEFTVATRAGNKKVTLVNNLEVFGIDPQEFAHTVQIGVAASTSVYAAPNRKEGNEVLVQGNQIKFIAKLLIDNYKIPKKYMKGLENAPKQGKKN